MADVLFDEMIKRQLKENPEMAKMVDPPAKARPRQMEAKPISPKMAMILGSLADSASTAAFLAQGRKEANPALQVFNRKPWTVVPAAAGGALGYHLLHKLISKKSPKLADTLAGGIGAYHAALAGNNMSPSVDLRPHGTEQNSYVRTANDLWLGPNAPAGKK